MIQNKHTSMSSAIHAPYYCVASYAPAPHLMSFFLTQPTACCNSIQSKNKTNERERDDANNNRDVGSDVPDLIGGDSEANAASLHLVQGSANESRCQDGRAHEMTLPPPLKWVGHIILHRGRGARMSPSPKKKSRNAKNNSEVGSNVPDLIGGDSQEQPEGSSLVRGSLNQSRDHEGRARGDASSSSKTGGSAYEVGQYSLRNEEKAKKKKGVGSDVPDLIGGDSQEHPECSSLVQGSSNRSRDHDVGRGSGT